MSWEEVLECRFCWRKTALRSEVSVKTYTKRCLRRKRCMRMQMDRVWGRLMRSSWMLAGALLPVVGCGGGGMSLIAIAPETAQVLDSGQTLTVTASVVNDSTHQGASFTLTGG